MVTTHKQARSALFRAEAKRWAMIKAARADPAAFVEYAIPNEKTGRRIANADFHVEWHRFLDAHRRAVLMAPVEHGKTQQVSVARPLHALGRDHRLRLAIVSNTSRQAEKVLGSIRAHIESNPRVRECFPTLRRSEKAHDPWHSTAITVERDIIAKDPSVQAVGVAGPILGSRLDGVVLDDVLDFDNTRTKEQRDKILHWFDSTLFPRLTEGAWLWLVGTPWMPDDLMHELAKRPGFGFRKYSAVTNAHAPPAMWDPIWFSRQRLLETYDGMTPINFGRSYLCEVRLDAHSRFQQLWLDQMVAAGGGRRMLASAPKGVTGAPLPCFTGVDLGVGQDPEHDQTCLFTIAVDERHRRIVCEIQTGRWTAPEIVARIQDAYRRFNSIIVVESNGAQRFLLQFAGQQGLPVRPYFTTSQNKFSEEFGIESLAVELRAGMWVCPSGPSGVADAEAREWMREMLFYTPESHTGDRLMASWFAREAARQHLRPRGARMDTLSR